jgi:hypothetical protein
MADAVKRSPEWSEEQNATGISAGEIHPEALWESLAVRCTNGKAQSSSPSAQVLGVSMGPRGARDLSPSHMRCARAGTTVAKSPRFWQMFRGSQDKRRSSHLVRPFCAGGEAPVAKAFRGDCSAFFFLPRPDRSHASDYIPPRDDLRPAIGRRIRPRRASEPPGSHAVPLALRVPEYFSAF